MGEIVNKERLSKIVGITVRTLTEYQKEGMPIKKTGVRGQSNTYDTAEVIEWLIKKASNSIQALDRAKLRLVEAQAEMAELDVAEKKGALIPIEKMKYIFSGVLATFRGRILSLPTRLAPEIALHRDPKKIEKVLQVACNNILTELSEHDPDPIKKPTGRRQGSAKNPSASAAS